MGLYTGGIGKVLGPVQDGMWKMLPEYKAVEEEKDIEVRAVIYDGKFNEDKELGGGWIVEGQCLG